MTFSASDGVRLAGWFVAAREARGTVVLVHGFKTDRSEMIDRVSFLQKARYSVLLYDSRGCGESGGTFGAGATEDRDIVGAAQYVRSRGAPGSSVITVLGLSLGAGDAILAAAKERNIDGVIADSAWPDQRVQLERMNTLAIGGVPVPLLPYEARVVDALTGGHLEDARPRDAVDLIVLPRSILFIHCAEDDNATTPLVAAEAMAAAHGVAGESRAIHVVPGCRHAGAFAADPADYERAVLAFLSNFK